jgi:rRNA maturation RNase YbeY
MEQVKALQPTRGWGELSVILVDDDGIIPVQQACFGKHVPTDVISQVYEPMPPEPDLSTGDVIVNVERARQVGGSGGSSRELALYLAHGCQHLTGASDHTPALRAAMRRRETAWLKAADAAGLLDGLMEEEETSPLL